MRAMEEIFYRRPFKVRNADEYDLANVLNLFVSPIDGLSSPFDFENTIVKGRMGSGKTMYLRANHAYHLYGLVPALFDGASELILPILIRLSDFQHIRKPEEVYRAVITKVIEEITSTYLYLQDARKLAGLHAGMKLLSDDIVAAQKLSATMRQLMKLDSSEYVERVSSELGLMAGVKHKFLELSAAWKESNLAEFKRKANPGIKDIEECYKNLLEDHRGKLLLLIDEAGALDRGFFHGEGGESAFFEILMNQFRTTSFIRTKIAVYPNSYSDMLTETRYGDVVTLEDSVREERSYKRFRARVVALVENYLNPESHTSDRYLPDDIFDLSSGGCYGDCLEQLIYASSGNMRRLIHLLDMVMNTAYRAESRPVKITIAHAFECLKEHAEKISVLFSEQEIEFLSTIVTACKARGSFKLTFPYMSPALYKYTSKSQEYNIMRIEELGAGRKRTVYSFDYSYCVLKDIPTHHVHETEKIHRERSLQDGDWISRIVNINQQVIDHAALPGKIEGVIDFMHKEVGFIAADSGEQYFYQKGQIIDSDKEKLLVIGKRLRFYPVGEGESRMATSIEVL